PRPRSPAGHRPGRAHPHRCPREIAGMTKLVVVGGGISGLAAAWFGAHAGYDVVVLEAAPQVGGKLRIEEVAGIPVDVGAEALLGGVYAGRADELSLRATMAALAAALESGGSLIAAARAVTDGGTRAADGGGVFTTLRGGLGKLPAALAAPGRFEVRTGVTVR